jgi:hypothetical protein
MPEQDTPSGPSMPEPPKKQGKPDVCERTMPEQAALIDRIESRLSTTSCASARWFDGFFGNDTSEDAHYRATRGSISVGSLWDQRDGFDPRVRFRARMHLPKLNDRLSAFIGRVDEEQYIASPRNDFDALPAGFSRAGDESLLLGLGYRHPAGAGRELDSDLGVRVGFPLDPYIRTNYRYTRLFADTRWMAYFRESVYWQHSEGFGTTARLDLHRSLSPRFLIRWTPQVKLTQETRGIEWSSTVTLFQSLDPRRALAWQAGIEGRTDNEVPLTNYGVRLLYRKQIARKWLFLELRSSVDWPRELVTEERKPDWGLGAALEMQFGREQP